MSIGQGFVRIRFTRPSGFGRSYRDSVPRLSVDGVDKQVDGWGTEVISLPAGPHWLRVWVTPARAASANAAAEPAFDGAGRLGVAEGPVTVGLGRQTAVDYTAPRFGTAHGTLRVVAAQASDPPDGFSDTC
jgi:hypothetical protein